MAATVAEQVDEDAADLQFPKGIKLYLQVKVDTKAT